MILVDKMVQGIFPSSHFCNRPVIKFDPKREAIKSYSLKRGGQASPTGEAIKGTSQSLYVRKIVLLKGKE